MSHFLEQLAEIASLQVQAFCYIFDCDILHIVFFDIAYSRLDIIFSDMIAGIQDAIGRGADQGVKKQIGIAHDFRGRQIGMLYDIFQVRKYVDGSHW